MSEDTASIAAYVQGWNPPEETREETLDPGPCTALAGVLDRPSPVRRDGDPLPPLWHWTHFLDRPAESELGPDGHRADGAFLPPIPGRHRMFAGGRLEVAEPLRAGERAVRTSRVARVQAKRGRSGELLFVTEEHVFTVDGRTRMTEQQDVVYRRHVLPPERTAPEGEPPPPDGGPLSLRLEPTAATLFRFSALTYNAHRIHYDHPYATGVEGYPGLVVHGPLLAIAMLEPLRRLGRPVRRYAFRLRRPAFLGAPVLIGGDLDATGADLRAHSAAADPAATARAEFEDA
ncbi:FAS1-like dehydratase domain-containing protein [Nocardiopsis potens]|uniref:FAS1-like dehydratase domain-containing protein n=1 Tax=Nocardiopsis potens TaxID=1246458 RepID=UPI000345B0BA|nr:MaoC family dehydratase N-terminal domain-containing protein [Nocardiopsis potens]